MGDLGRRHGVKFAAPCWWDGSVVSNAEQTAGYRHARRAGRVCAAFCERTRGEGSGLDGVGSGEGDRRMPDREDVQIRLGAEPLIFTAPHAIYLQRDGKPNHKPEDHTGFLAEALAEEVGGSCITWSSREVTRSSRTGAPNPTNRDPNYLLRHELETNPWNDALRACCGRWPPWACLVVDLHGRRNHEPGVNDDSDCDAGLGAMEAFAPEQVEALRAALHNLQPALQAGFVLNRTPRLAGCWPARTGRCTITQQAVGCGQAAVQLELTLRLRRDLFQSAAARTDLARALLAVARACSAAACAEACRPAVSPLVYPLFVWAQPLELLRAWTGCAGCQPHARRPHPHMAQRA